MELHTVTAKIPASLHRQLEKFARKEDRKKSYMIRQAIEEYIEDKKDYEDAMKRIAEDRKEERLSLEEVMRKYGLEN